MFKWIIGGADAKLRAATAGIQKYVAKFEAAAIAAEEELSSVDGNLKAKINKFDSKLAVADVKLDKAYNKHAVVTAKMTTKTTEAQTKAEARKAELAQIAATARKAVDNHNAIYLS